MFLTIKKSSIFIALACIICAIAIPLFFNYLTGSTSAQIRPYCVVLDAGHGGSDGGCVGASGVKESDLNLLIVKKMVPYFEDFGIKVVLTRSDAAGLSDIGSDNEKLSDMEARRDIIQNANANLVLSIHMNSFPDSREHGIQTFYQEDIEDSKRLAEAIQDHLISHIDGARPFANSGDYYILKCSTTPTALVECGYLSNPSDEANLIRDDYQEKLAYHIFCGVLRYFQLVGK